MIRCNHCGVAYDGNSPYCPNCGCPTPAPQYPAYRQQPETEPVSIGGWIGRSLIPCIPLVGGLVYLIMLFIWSGDKKKEETFRNWAKAQLIITAVVVVLSIILGIAFGATLVELLQYM